MSGPRLSGLLRMRVRRRAHYSPAPVRTLIIVATVSLSAITTALFGRPAPDPAPPDPAGDRWITGPGTLTFTSAPALTPTMVAGSVAVHLGATPPVDGFWTAMVDDIAPDGAPTLLTSVRGPFSATAPDSGVPSTIPARARLRIGHRLRIELSTAAPPRAESRSARPDPGTAPPAPR
ncbi:MAG: hypothetical protein J2P18_09580 [Nocardia sp.]|nr:hypothetical protein [Nocardia sp.]